jgi:GDP/UDP-N,N'-diacetylbacillosamine 2-epimerase (hydrolysing)
VTKLSHLHFATNAESAQRIVGLGEQSFRIFNTGNPGLDRFRTEPVIELSELSERLNFELAPGEPFLILLQHVISSEIEDAYVQIKESLEAIKELGLKTILIHPNSDAGSNQIVRAIKEYEQLSFIHVVKNIPRLEFVNLMRNTSCLLGNSSAGILEAPFLGLPVINVGNRQHGRIHSDNVQYIGHDKDQIVSALKKAVFDPEYRKKVSSCANPFGDGRSAERIAGILASVDINDALINKDMTF